MRNRLILAAAFLALFSYLTYEGFRYLVLKIELAEASHRAVAFGASSSSEKPHYSECALIRNFAKSAQHFAKFDDRDILLEIGAGYPDGIFHEYCQPDIDLDDSLVVDIHGMYSVKVTVHGEYTPLFLRFFHIPVEGRTARTIILPIKVIELPEAISTP